MTTYSEHEQRLLDQQSGAELDRRMDGRSKPRKIECRWCGKEATVFSHKAKFCGEECNKAFNRLRTKRGPLVYDMLMAGRFERKDNPGYLSRMSQLARQFRDEDTKERGGRQSWSDPEDRI